MAGWVRQATGVRIQAKHLSILPDEWTCWNTFTGGLIEEGLRTICIVNSKGGRSLKWPWWCCWNGVFPDRMGFSMPTLLETADLGSNSWEFLKVTNRCRNPWGQNLIYKKCSPKVVPKIVEPCGVHDRALYIHFPIFWVMAPMAMPMYAW